MGPISLRPVHGAGWAPPGRPERLRATYNVATRSATCLGLDVHRGRLWARMRPRPAGIDNLGFMRTIRLCYRAGQRIYWVQDNLSANWTPDIRAYAAANKIELVPSPTYASYLNRIESHFRPIQEFVFNNTDCLDLDWPSAQRPAPSAQRPAPSAQRPAPSAQRPAPSAQRPARTGRPTSPTATAPTATVASPRSSAAIGSPPDVISVKRFGGTH